MTLPLARRAERFPDRTAIVDISEERLYAPAETVTEDRVTYAELSRITAQTVGALRERGVEPGDTVCLITRNRIASLALLFACHRLGATLAPISHRLTPATVKRPFEALEPTLVVAEAAQRDLVRSIPFDRAVTLADLENTNSESEDGTTAEESAAETPLIAFHGKPGRPVVVFTANALERNCITATVTWGISSNDSAIVLDPLSTPDGLVRAALPLLYVGGTLLLDRAFDPGDTLTAIDNYDVTTVTGRGSPIHDLVANENADALAGLERAICDSSVGPDDLDAILDHDVSTFRVYGRLECPTAMSQTVSETGPQMGVGRPVLDCQARLVDDEGTVLEGAADGTLQLSGPVLADEYVNAAGTGDSGGSREMKQERGSSEGTNQRESTQPGTRTDEGGRFVDGWLDTDDRFRRDADGVYYRA